MLKNVLLLTGSRQKCTGHVRWIERCIHVYACRCKRRKHTHVYGTVRETGQMLPTAPMHTAHNLYLDNILYKKKLQLLHWSFKKILNFITLSKQSRSLQLCHWHLAIQLGIFLYHSSAYLHPLFDKHL